MQPGPVGVSSELTTVSHAVCDSELEAVPDPSKA